MNWREQDQDLKILRLGCISSINRPILENTVVIMPYAEEQAVLLILRLQYINFKK
jgi:hypothetical protein